MGAEFNGRVILDKALNEQRSITLKYHENQFTILMASDNGGVNNKTRFAYRLKGFNDMWIKTSNGQADITYMGLPPGNYTFCVRVLHDNGTMDDEVSELDIEILSPWYRSWWAWILYALLIVILFFGQGRMVRAIKRLGKKQSQAPQENADDAEAATSDEAETVEEAILMDE